MVSWASSSEMVSIVVSLCLTGVGCELWCRCCGRLCLEGMLVDGSVVVSIY